MDVWILWGPRAGDGPRRGSRASGDDRQARRADRPRPRPRTAAARRGRRPPPRRPGLPATGLHQGRPADRRLERRRHASCGCSRATRSTAGWQPERARRSAARRGRRLLSRRSPRSASAWSTSCSPRAAPAHAAAVAGRDGSARRLDLLGPAGGGRVPPGGDSRAGDHPLPATPAARRAVGRGAAPAMAVSRRRVGLRSGTGRAAGRRRDGLELDAAAHREEHAIEVQLPLLARLAPQVRVVGIAVGDGSLPELLRFGGRWPACCATCPSARCWSFPAT